MINIAELADTTHGRIITEKKKPSSFEVLLNQGNKIKLKMGKHGSTDAYYIILFSDECLKMFKIGELW